MEISPKQLQFHHISMNVENYDQCLLFYHEFGFQMYCNWAWEDDAPDHEKGCRNCFLSLETDTVIEFHEVRAKNKPNGIIGHVCFHADTPEHVDLLYKKALECGAKSLVEPFTIDLNCFPKPVLGARVCHLLGMAGEQIEFICWNGYDPF